MIVKVCVVAVLVLYEVHTQYISIPKDFTKINKDAALTAHVKEILDRLATFQLPMHPRIKSCYELLRRGIYMYTQATADSIYMPYKYNEKVPDNVTTKPPAIVALKHKDTNISTPSSTGIMPTNITMATNTTDTGEETEE